MEEKIKQTQRGLFAATNKISKKISDKKQKSLKRKARPESNITNIVYKILKQLMNRK